MTAATSKLTLFRRSLALAGAIVAAGIATTSFAGSATDVPAVPVRYDDLNLATSSGVDTLYRRISLAARDVCPDVYSRDLTIAYAAKRCQADAIDHAVHAMNNPKLASLHASHVSRG